jgi:hypothetical protein
LSAADRASEALKSYLTACPRYGYAET